MRVPTKIAEIQKREEGLQTSIDSSNKGFAMLKKMGYKEGKISIFISHYRVAEYFAVLISLYLSTIIFWSGESLGKSNQGRLEPIPIEVRNDRSGIGREDALQKVIETKYKIRQKHREEQIKRKEINDRNFAEEFR